MSTFITIISVPLILYIAVRLYLKLPQFGRLPQGLYLEKLQSSPQFIKGRFRNQSRIETHMSVNKIPVLIKQNRNKDIQKRPSRSLPIDLSALYSKNDHTDLQFTWMGHSALILDVKGFRILIDPMLGNYASPVPGTVRRFSKMKINWDQVAPVDLILYSHDHYDHIDYKSFQKLKKKTSSVIGSLGIEGHLTRWGYAKEKILECDWGDSHEINGMQFHCCPTKHFSGRTIGGRDMCLWSSWVIDTGLHKIYFSSDSGYFAGFREVGEKHGPFDLCFVECGQYNHLWKENHMFPEESIEAFRDLKGRFMVPIHWGGFSLAPHDWRDPVERLLHAASQEEQHKIILPRLGETLTWGEEIQYPHEKWWLNFE